MTLKEDFPYVVAVATFFLGMLLSILFFPKGMPKNDVEVWKNKYESKIDSLSIISAKLTTLAINQQRVIHLQRERIGGTFIKVHEILIPFDSLPLHTRDSLKKDALNKIK